VWAPKIDLQTGVGATAQADAKLILDGAKETTQTYHTESDTSLLWLLSGQIDLATLTGGESVSNVY
jgi:hypothetical protein